MLQKHIRFIVALCVILLLYSINQGNVPVEIIVFFAGLIDTPVTVVEPVIVNGF
jgi:uncharacterized membrane protein